MASYTFLPNPHWQDTSGKDECTTQCDNTFIACPWWMMCAKRYTNVIHAPRMDLKWRTSEALALLSRRTPWARGHWYFRTASNDHARNSKYFYYNGLVFYIDTSEPGAKINSTRIATIFLNNWGMPYEMHSKVLTDNVPHFVSRYFSKRCHSIGVKGLITTNYHLQTTGHVECYNRTIVAHLCHCVSEIEIDWNT